jgi:hypothetical protein
MTAYTDEEPIATWKAPFLEWGWEAYEKEDDGLYYGRVTSPLVGGTWEWGYFTEEQLRTAGAYRTDEEDDQERFPDGGVVDDLAEDKQYETELDALLDPDDGGDGV